MQQSRKNQETQNHCNYHNKSNLIQESELAQVWEVLEERRSGDCNQRVTDSVTNDFSPKTQNTVEKLELSEKSEKPHLAVTTMKWLLIVSSINLPYQVTMTSKSSWEDLHYIWPPHLFRITNFSSCLPNLTRVPHMRSAHQKRGLWEIQFLKLGNNAKLTTNNLAMYTLLLIQLPVHLFNLHYLLTKNNSIMLLPNQRYSYSLTKSEDIKPIRPSLDEVCSFVVIFFS